MAIQFDELDDYYIITDAASLTLPDDDWCVAIWTYVADNTGTESQYVYSTGGWSAANTINLALYEATYGTVGNRNKFDFCVEDGDGTSISGDMTQVTATGGDSIWRLVLVQRNTSENRMEFWFCSLGAVATMEYSVADTDLGAINGGDWNIGRRTDGQAARYYGGIACEFFIINAALTQAEITALGTGLRPHDLGYVSNIYLEMFTADATLRDMFGSNDAARQSAPTSVHHQPIMRTPRAAVFNDAPSLY